MGMSKGRRSYPQCRQCINRQLDPFSCMTCEDASNFEPELDDGEIEEVIEFRDLMAEMRREEEEF
jgi:hypothetical protein